MRPDIALDLSLDGIAVLSRAPAGPDEGKWYREGVVRLDAPDMTARLRKLRGRCADRHGDDFTSILVIPDSQLLFTSVERDDRDPRSTIRAQLAGRTPYAVDALAFDYVVRGDRLQVAVVALETLSEAESFAVEFGFRPVALVAAPRDAAYRGMAEFGATKVSADLLGGDRLRLDLGEGFDVMSAPPPSAVPASEPVPPDAPQSFADFVAAPTTPSLPTPQRPSVPPVAPSAPPRAKAATPVRVPPPSTVPAQVPEAGETAATPPGATADLPSASSEESPGSATADPTPPEPVATFSTRRRAGPPASDRLEAGPAPADPPPNETDSLPPRPTDTASAGTGDAAADTKVRTPAALAKIDAALRAPVTPTLSLGNRKLAGIAARFGGAGKAAPTAPVATASAMAADGALSEAEALSLPGISRTRAAPPPRRSGLRLGFYLTLSLLGVLAAIALWAVLAAPGGQPVDNATPASLPTSAAAPPGGSDSAALDSVLDGDAPVAGADADGPDLALLLPASSDAAAPDTSASGLVSPPLPLPLADASPEELVEAADADPDLTPAPDQTLAVTAAPALEQSAAEGRFDAVPGLSDPPQPRDGSEIYLASIDPVVVDGDAVALPRAAPPTDAFAPQTSPAPAGTDFPTGPDGLVIATPEGALAPGGYSVVAGRPQVEPSPRPDAAPLSEAPEAAAVTEAQAELRRIRPIPRPDDAAERVERVAFNGLSRTELTRVRPRARPAEVEARGTAAVARADAVQEVVEEERSAAVQAAAASALASLARQPDVQETGASVSRYALARSGRPDVRPRSVEQSAERIVASREQAPAAPATAVTSQPAARQADSGQQTVRSAGGSVTRAATESNAISLREMNLIGVYGSPKARRALIRMANGRYVKVEVGDRLDRGRVVAIGESEVVYQRGGRNVALRMPST